MIAGDIARFVEAFGRTLRRDAERDQALAQFASALATIEPWAARPQADRPVTHPALLFLPRALAGLDVSPELTAAIRAIVPHLRWASTYLDQGPGAEVARRMTWGEIAGHGALVETDQLRCGCFLLAPGLIYPPHGHEAEEIYYVASGAVRFTHGFDDLSDLVRAPGYSVTPSGMAHALAVGPDPALIVYCWTGRLTEPTWWWDKNERGQWRKFTPERSPG